MIATQDSIQLTDSLRGRNVMASFTLEAPPRPPPQSVHSAPLIPSVVGYMSSGAAPEPSVEFKLSQCFGDCSPAEEVTEADILSAVQFDSTGEYLATGDRGGRVVIFKKHSGGKHKVSSSGKVKRTSDYKFFTEFQSHEAEFDYLKSLEIEEKINQIKWCSRANNALFLLSTNDKTVKMWKICEKRVKKVTYTGRDCPAGRGPHTGRNQRLALPHVSITGTVVDASPRRVFANAHAYHVNSIDPNCDGEHFVSTDDLRINLWNLEITDRSFNIVDIKPKNMEELTEVITSATFHPTHCNVFMYSSSRGCIKMGDMRASALCDQHAKVLEKPVDPGSKSFFSEIVASISDMKTTRDGRYIISRDYMTLKLWDINMETHPVRTINVHEHLRSQLCDLYENDCIFDKFECAISGDASSVLTGSYNNLCHMYDRYGQTQASLEVCKDPSKRTTSKKGKRRTSHESAPLKEAPGLLEYDKKILHMSWHPQDDIIAVAGNNKLYIYTQQ